VAECDISGGHYGVAAYGAARIWVGGCRLYRQVRCTSAQDTTTGFLTYGCDTIDPKSTMHHNAYGAVNCRYAFTHGDTGRSNGEGLLQAYVRCPGTQFLDCTVNAHSQTSSLYAIYSGGASACVVPSHEAAASTATSFSKNVDAVFSGHTHVPFAKTVTGAEGNQIAVVQADHYGWALGRIRLSYDPASRKTSVVSADNKDLRSSSCTTDAYGVAGIVSQAEKDSAAEGGKPLAKIGSDFLRGSDGSGPGANRGTESTASNLIAESFRSWLATDIQPTGSTRYVGIMNPGGVRADLLYAASGSEGDGVLTSGEAYTVQPFGNEMAYTTLTGAELKALLSQQWQPGSSRPVLTLGLSRNVDVLTEATTDPAYGGEAGAAPAMTTTMTPTAPIRSSSPKRQAARNRAARRRAPPSRTVCDRPRGAPPSARDPAVPLPLLRRAARRARETTETGASPDGPFSPGRVAHSRA